MAAGINTPASTVILAEQEFIGEEERSFTTAEYKNMAGRAGRVGFNEEGKAIILADTPYEREILFRRYVKGQVEEMRSSQHCQPKGELTYVYPNSHWTLIAGGDVVRIGPYRLIRPRASACSGAGTDVDCP